MSQTEEAHVRRSLSHTMQTEEAHDGHKTLMTERDAHARQKTLTSQTEETDGRRLRLTEEDHNQQKTFIATDRQTTHSGLTEDAHVIDTRSSRLTENARDRQRGDVHIRQNTLTATFILCLFNAVSASGTLASGALASADPVTPERPARSNQSSAAAILSAHFVSGSVCQSTRCSKLIVF